MWRQENSSWATKPSQKDKEVATRIILHLNIRISCKISYGGSTTLDLFNCLNQIPENRIFDIGFLDSYFPGM
ncbi:hypothetical protein MtrunA17_Chr7g0272551 [Medicago truncatula]|uniref:Uncharacterized protein n=1 Tax=Medicago truncatula TaxID=3880 RepID=A2Q328_MEDTR|nr:hypothetical protein MtrDRAFT_AC154391g14v2 [Medicago truncatula]AES82467.1 hypothetical protein MTR_7g113090 [Medicago truncatula]RHN49254.1 hypothetical protein MtrunA17_Chr7g0272551 [Medicago truncatula]